MNDKLMKSILYILSIFAFTCWFTSCSQTIKVDNKLDTQPSITPNYSGVTIPPNIAPLNFKLNEPYQAARAVCSYGTTHVEVDASDNQFYIPKDAWKKLLNEARGATIQITIYTQKNDKWTQYADFPIHIAAENIDSHLAYRLIEPGYEIWNQMGIYQRNLETYEQTAIYENKLSKGNCVNCHSFCMQDPDQMLFHLREGFSGTMIMQHGKVEKLNTKTKETLSSLTYPSWHPSGKFVAFSVNNILQGFHTNNLNRVEVFDTASDVVVYDVERHEVVTTPLLFGKNAFETFPTFSPDGKQLYFSSASAVAMPDSFAQVRYNLCSIAFDPQTRTFGSVVDTLFHADNAGKSVSFPRVSPKGDQLMYTLSDYGNFSIWHREADLWMVDLQTGEHTNLEILNSEEVESYHAWSNNGRWVVFSSRRIDGLYTRPYIAYIDAKGTAHKPFLLPQERVDYYDRLMKSYNIPEFIRGEVSTKGRVIALKAQEKGTDIKFVKQ